MIGKAAEMMTSQVMSIKPDDTLEIAIKLLAENNISGLPVINESNMLVGIISESDIIEYSSKLQVVSRIGSSGWISPYTDVSSMATVNKGHDLLTNTKVKEIMTKKVTTVKEDTPGDHVIMMMRKKSINRLPVTDDNGLLVGIITRSDIINYLANNR